MTFLYAFLSTMQNHDTGSKDYLDHQVSVMEELRFLKGRDWSQSYLFLFAAGTW